MCMWVYVGVCGCMWVYVVLNRSVEMTWMNNKPLGDERLNATH